VTGQVGNALTGSFHLRLRGHVSDPIPFDASSDRMKAMLESMPNVGTVDISRSPPNQVCCPPMNQVFYPRMNT